MLAIRVRLLSRRCSASLCFNPTTSTRHLISGTWQRSLRNPLGYHRTLSTSSFSSSASSHPTDADGSSKRHQPNPHSQFYREFVPAMIPIFLIGSAVYVSLQLAQSYLSHEKYATEARARIADLERELHELRAAQTQQSSSPSSLSTSTTTQNSSFLRRWWG